MATVLSVYQEALRFLGEARLATVSDDVESRYVLDDAWDEAIIFILRQAPWRFALEVDILTGTTGGYTAGFTYKFTKPSDWLRTHSIFVAVAGKEFPVDVREYDTQLYCNTEELSHRYVSDHVISPALFPEHFAKALAAYLAFATCEKITRDPNRAQQMYSLFQQYLAAAMQVDAVPESPWFVHQLDGSFLSSAHYVLAQGGWRFAMTSETISASGTPQVGFPRAFFKPADYHRLVSAFVLDSVDRECPVDMRESETRWSADTPSTTLSIRYISTDGLDATLWPEAFRRVVAAHLGIDSGDSPAQEEGKSGNIWPQYLVAALQLEAIPVSPWLPYQLDGSFISAARKMLQQGFWTFALKQTTPSAAGTPLAGYSNSYAIPASWLRTYSIFVLSGSKECPVDAREQESHWSANEAIKVRFISSEYLDATLWPDEFLTVVAAYLGIDQGDGSIERGKEPNAGPVWKQYLVRALENLALPPNPWLPYQLDGTFLPAVNYVLEQGLWRFAIVTDEREENGEPASPGYTYAFDKPPSWIRTVNIFQPNAIDHDDIDYRDEDGQFHTNYNPIVLRYLSKTLGQDATVWSDAFTDAVLAYLSWRRAVATPGTPGAVMQARSLAYLTLVENARGKDDMRDRPRVRQPSRLTAARGGWGGRYGREQGW